MRTATASAARAYCAYPTDPVLPFFLERYAAAYRAELATFIAAVESGHALKPDGEDGLKALLLADAATQSAKTGQVVKLALAD